MVKLKGGRERKKGWQKEGGKKSPQSKNKKQGDSKEKKTLRKEGANKNLQKIQAILVYKFKKKGAGG